MLDDTLFHCKGKFEFIVEESSNLFVGELKHASNV